MDELLPQQWQNQTMGWAMASNPMSALVERQELFFWIQGNVVNSNGRDQPLPHPFDERFSIAGGAN